jgi:dTDP-4-dehydrorhamnose 3,5-epimerase
MEGAGRSLGGVRSRDETTGRLGVDVMEIREQALPGVVMVRPRVFRDERGFFSESWNKRTFESALGAETDFVQDNHSASTRGVLRGLHYQLVRPQGKLVRVSAGAVFDVAVDLRRTSATFGEWIGVELSAESGWQLWVPSGFAHGFLTVTDSAELQYKVTDYYVGDLDRSIRWDDPDIGIDWPDIGTEVLLSEKDEKAPFLRNAEVFD